MSIQQSNGAVNLQAALNRLVKAGTVDPNILLKYSQNPPPDLGDKGALLVSLASSIVARNKEGINASMPAPSETITEQIQNKLAQSNQPQGLASIVPPQAPTEMMAQAPQMPQAPTEMMAQGGVADLNVGDMFNEQNYADGGIVAFAGGGPSYDPYAAFRMPIPKVPMRDDLILETEDLKSGFVDANFYKKRKQELEDQTREDINESKAADKASILFALAEGFDTPGSFLKGAVKSGVKAGPAVANMNKNIIAAKRLNRAALNELEQAKYAESVGDYKTAATLKESAKNREFEAQKLNATTGATLEAANIKAAAVNKMSPEKIRIAAAREATTMLTAKFGPGAFDTMFTTKDKAMQNYYNQLVKYYENYFTSNKQSPITAPVPRESLETKTKEDSSKNNKKETKAPVKETQAQYINRRKEEKAKQKYPLVNKNYDQTPSDAGGNVIDAENAEAMRILEDQGAFNNYDSDQGP